MRKIFLIFFVLSVGSAFGGDAKLLKEARKYFSPIPDLFPSDTNPLTPEKIKLGKILFYEKRISIDGTTSCAKCHPIGYYGTDRLPKSKGNFSKENPRNAPTVFNSAGQIAQHWRGDRRDVEDQAKRALLGKGSFGALSYKWVEDRLKEIKGYKKLFKEAFPEDKDPVNVDNFAKAVGAWERTLTTPSRFDRFLKGHLDALSKEEKEGLKEFIKVGCVSCHSGTLVGGNSYQKFGILEPYWKYTKSKKVDYGRYNITKKDEDKYVFKVPPLRNVEKTSPYFHDGSVKDLKKAIWIMGKVQLGKELSDKQVSLIEAFLKSLTGKLSEDIKTLPVMP
ncbi:cytochrome c peroxidase [Persephonella sp.]|uniref:cytochrome-c peroxidase n=1 Tax=Persephonella sp. TaxID=2060922 RepID=UPI0025F17D6D|nr:cytochrome c peroxidase [Persephonella sp.]